MPHNFQRVVGRQGQMLHCIGQNCQTCEVGKVFSHIPYFNTYADHAWADLNGEPFKAYYCEDCKQKAEVSNA